LKKKLKKPDHLSNIYYEFPDNEPENPLLNVLVTDLQMTSNNKY